MHAHCRSLGRSLLMHCVPSCCSKLLSLCCITERTKLLLDWDTCLHEKKVRLQAESLLRNAAVQKGKQTLSYQDKMKGSVLVWDFGPFFTRSLWLWFLWKKYQVAEKSRTIIVIWTSQISWQQVPHVADN